MSQLITSAASIYSLCSCGIVWSGAMVPEAEEAQGSGGGFGTKTG